ncbi:MAG: hypothetical protein JJE21_10880 [Spirochaetaceae bacterium]|nr:hypothetical protein [Spirochaetaceae bacterium]
MFKIIFKKKIIIILFIAFLTLNNIFAISPSVSVGEIGQDSSVGKDIFPISSVLNYHVYDFPGLYKNPLKLDVQLYGGYGTAYVGQNPSDGLAFWCDNYKPDSIGNRTYGKIYNGWEFKLSQKLLLPQTIPGTLNSWVSYTSRFERPINLADYWSYNDSDRPSLFNSTGSSFFDGTSVLIGTPDLQGNMYLNTNGFNLGLQYRYNLFDLPYSISLNTYFAPKWFSNESSEIYGGESDYFKIAPSFSISKVLYEVNYKDFVSGKKFRLLKLQLSESVSYRYLKGDAVPIFAQSSSNLRHDISNTFKLSIYGPQFITGDTYPSANFYYSSDYKWGQLNNTNVTAIYPSEKSFSHSLNLNFDIRIIGIFHYAMSNSYTFGTDAISWGVPYFYVHI